MTKKQQQALLQKAIGAAYALQSRSISTTTSSSSSSSDSSGYSSTDSEDGIRLPDGEISNLACASASDPETGFYFSDEGIVFVVNGSEALVLTPEGVNITGDTTTGSEGSEEVASNLVSNVIGTSVTQATWANLAAIEFCAYPVTTLNTTGFFIYLSEDNGTISKSDKVYFVSLKGQTTATTYLCSPSSFKESGPTYWDILVKASSTAANFYIRRNNSSTTTSTAKATVSVSIVSVAPGALAVKPPITLSGSYATIGVQPTQISTKSIVSDPTATGYTSFSTKQNGKSATGGTATATAQDKLQLSFPSASPARSNGVTTENGTDRYELRATYFSNDAVSGDKIYDVTWENQRFAPNYVPNDAKTAAHQHKMGAGTAVEQIFVWPRTAPSNGSHLLQTTYATATGTHTLGYVAASSLTNSVQNFDGPSSGVTTIRQMSQAAYDALASKNSNTLYVIV